MRVLPSLDALGKRYGKRPSDFLPGLSEYQRLSIDIRAANLGAQKDQMLIDKEKEKIRRGK